MRRIIILLGVISSLFAGSWIRIYESSEEIGYGIGRSVRQTLDGGYIVVGSWQDNSDYPPQTNLWLIKTDTAGDTMWTRTYGRGGQVIDEGMCVQQTTDGGYIITGYTDGNDMYFAGALWLLKTDADGDTQWTKKYKYNFGHEKGYWVEQTEDEGYIVTGQCNPTGGFSRSLWLLKTDEAGDTLWTRTRLSDEGRCVRQTNDGGYVVASTMGLFRTDDKGDSLWIIPWPGRCVEETSDSGYVLIGHTWIESRDIRLRKTDVVGDSMWTRVYGGGEKTMVTASSRPRTEDS